jgi:hypothetical protein
MENIRDYKVLFQEQMKTYSHIMNNNNQDKFEILLKSQL